jgi:hypothetical protein
MCSANELRVHWTMNTALGLLLLLLLAALPVQPAALRLAPAVLGAGMMLSSPAGHRRN